MRDYSREEKMALCKKSNQNRKAGKDNFEGFSKEDKLALALWQVEVLNKNSNLDHVREAWERWNRLAKVLIVELLKESLEVETVEEVETNFKNLETLEIYHNGKYKTVKQMKNGDYIEICERCGGTGTATQYMYNDNGFCYKCMGSGKGKKIKYTPITDDEIIEDLFNRYKKKCKKKNQLEAPNFIIEKWFKMEKEDLIKHFLNII